MKRIDTEFTLGLGEFRMASYYGLFLRHRRPLQILFGVLLFALAYLTGSLLGLGAPNPLVFLLAAAYLVWGLLLFAGTERDIRRYIGTPGNLIGCAYRMILEDHRLRIEIPERDVRESFNLHRLTCCFELSALFLFYTSLQNVYILPKRALTPEETQALRALLAADCGERFSSRFLQRRSKIGSGR